MKVNNIESGNYVGYYWMSNSSKPERVDGTPFFVALDEKKNPFVMEAQLYDPLRQISYSVRYVDGHFLIHRFDLTRDFENGDYEYSEIEYVANRLPDVDTFLFRQYWKAEGDPIGCTLCEGMKTLRPNALVFVGFKNKEVKQ